MSTFKDIIDTLNGIEGEVVDHILTTNKHQSVSKMAKEGIAYFPTLISDTLSIEDGTLVSKALERQYSSFMLICMTMNPYLVTNDGNTSVSNYINRFHQNIDVKATPTDLLNAINTFSTEALNKFDVEYDSTTMESFQSDLQAAVLYHVYENTNYKNINKENMKFGYTIDDVTESTILNDLSNRRISGTSIPMPTMEARGTGRRNNNGSYYASGAIVGDNIERQHNDNSSNYFFQDSHREDNSTRTNYDLSHHEIHQASQIDSGAMGRGIGRELARGQRVIAGGDRRQLQHMMDNDVKKANELVPTLLHMRVYPVTKEGDQLPPIDFVLGIKATLHPISSSEMITNICRGIKNENTFFNFVRWTTGEIKFLKDFVLNLNELKIDAINSSNRASKWWSMLKRRKAMAKIKNIVLPNKMVPNATIVITQDEMETIKEVYGYDLNNEMLVNKLMSNYFLLGFVIVDPALQRVKFLFDGSTQYETLTYASLARESSTNDKQFKEMLNMLGRRM